MADYTLDVQDRVATLTLTRPHRKNALTYPMIDALSPEVEALHDRDDVGVFVVTGAGGSFCSGADLVDNAPALQGGAESRAKALASFHRFLLAVWNFPVPTVASIPGDAVGFGFDLTLACDMRFASSSARFSQSFTKIALVPDGGSSLTLPRMVGYAKAFELGALAELFSSEEALRLGLVNRVVGDDELAGAVSAIAARLAAGAPLALRGLKANLRAAMGYDMEAALANEARTQVDMLASQDLMIGIQAWMTRSTPEFTGR